MRGSRVVWLAAAMALLSRFPGLLWPLRPDEAGFLTVARTWHPRADSLYGTHWVDRPPHLIWLLQWTDRIGGPYLHRLLGAVCCALLVLAAAAAAREVVRATEWATPRLQRRAASISAVVSAALVSNAEIDPVAAKGEVFALPLVMGACWLALRAVRVPSLPATACGGVLAALAVGMKQSMVGGMVLGGTVLVGAVLAGRVDLRTGLRLTAAASLGALLPVAASVAWALAAGVDLGTLWYDAVTFRFDASATIAGYQTSSGKVRSLGLSLAFLGSGMALVVVWLLVRGHRALLRLPVPAVPVLVMFSVDVTVLVLSGSYWKPYLFALIPGITLSLACLVAAGPTQRSWRPRLTNAVVALAVLSSVVSMVAWVGIWVRGTPPLEFRTGQAIAAASQPGDDLVVFGGRADIQWASGLPSPYEHLWSLPMRTLDPRLESLGDLLASDRAPTWFVEAAPLGAWQLEGSKHVAAIVEEKYALVDKSCGRYRVHRLTDAGPATLEIDCDAPARGWFGTATAGED